MLQAVLGAKGRKFDSRKFGWLGVPVEDTGVCTLTKQSGILNAEDWLKSKKPVKLGATGPGSTTDDPPKILAAVTPLPIKIVEGYGGTATIRVAAERGEVAGGCWAWQSIKPTWRQGLESGNVNVIIKFSDHPDLKDVPSVYKFAKTDQDKKLLDVATDAYGAIARPYSLPPGVPAERVKILQTAFMETLKDPELLAEAKKAKLEINPRDGQWVAKRVDTLYKMDKKMLSLLKELIVPK
jgi:tripartite-type tricarboxylate transporter receptor subunit TctC